MTPPSELQHLAEHLCTTRLEHLPGPALRAAKRSLLDTLGVAMAARHATGMEAVATACAQRNHPDQATIWATGQKTSVLMAAFANSAYAAALDYDSLHMAAAVHPDIIVVPTVLAVAEQYNLDGASVLLGIALGDDLICRLAMCTQENSGWFYTSLYGAMASAAVAALLRGGNADTILNAMGLAYINTGGTQQPASERSVAKRAQAAMSVMVGMIAADLALAGLKGPQDILHGEFGLFSMYENGQTSNLLRQLSKEFEGERISYKAYPMCQCSHAAIDGLLRLKTEYSLTPAAIEKVSLRISPYMNRLVGAPFSPGATPQVDAQFSLQYGAARAILTGKLGIPEIQEKAVLDPNISELIRRIEINIDNMNPGKYAPVEITLHLSNGRVLRTLETDYSGSPKRPLTDNHLQAKFEDCLNSIGVMREGIDALRKSLYEIQHHDVARLIADIGVCLKSAHDHPSEASG